jgi:hypothetical protein
MFATSEPAVRERVVAVGLLTQRELSSLGPTFARAWPVHETPCFDGLLNAIDQADLDSRREQDADQNIVE